MFHQFKNFYDNYFGKGAYIKLTYNKCSVDNLYKYMISNNIPNMINMDDIHTTLLYTRKAIAGYIPSNKLNGIKVNPLKLDLWKTCDGLNCLVLLIESKDISNLHNYIVKQYNGKHMHNQYIPHITLSYNIDNNFNYKKLQLPDFDLIIENETIYDLTEKDIKNKYLEITRGII